MVDLKVLKAKNCTSNRLREIFCCEDASSPDHKVKERITELIESRINEGLAFNARTANLHMSVDLAWDSLPINKATIPLLQYAQGKVSLESCHSKLQDLDCASKFAEYDSDGELKSIDALRLYEVSVNLIRSYITRRHAAQVARFSNLFPFLKYDPRGTSPKEKVRADVLSQRVEIMADQFGYRHHFNQAIRDMFLYGHAISFPLEAWSRTVHWRSTNDEVFGDDDIESFTAREGVQLVTPHPTRVFWDESSTVSKINDDIGPGWIGYWDIMRYGDISRNAGYWNLDKVQFTNSMSGTVSRNSDFFGYYYDKSTLSFPKGNDDYAYRNDRVATTGLYSADDRDKGMFLTNLYMKLNPKAEGLGDYPFDVWIKFVVASDSTVLYAEYLPSIPAIYGGLNENDSRVSNVSMAHEIMPFQDQMNNIMTSMLHHMKVSMMKIIAIDSDALDDDVRDYLIEALEEDTFYKKPKALFYSGTKAADLGVNNNNFISVVGIEKELAQGINQSIQSVLQLLNLVERLLILSPQELGQAAPREISATEVTEISNTTNSIYAFISEGIDDMRAAAKKMLYEHLVCCSTTEYNVPVKGRYTTETVQAAGFDVEDTGDQVDLPRRRNVIGTPKLLLHDYLYTSRDGAERPRDVQSAQVLGQLLQQLLSIPDMGMALGKERVFDIINEIFRMSGAGYDLNLEIDELDEQATQQNTIQREQFLMTLQEQMPTIVTALEQLNERVGMMETGDLSVGEQAPGVPGTPVPPPPELQQARQAESAQIPI